MISIVLLRHTGLMPSIHYKFIAHSSFATSRPVASVYALQFWLLSPSLIDPRVANLEYIKRRFFIFFKVN